MRILRATLGVPGEDGLAELGRGDGGLVLRVVLAVEVELGEYVEQILLLFLLLDNLVAEFLGVREAVTVLTATRASRMSCYCIMRP